MKALKVEELDIDKVSVTLENMKHLSDIKEYSVTKLSMKEIGSVSLTVTITAWAAPVDSNMLQVLFAMCSRWNSCMGFVEVHFWRIVVTLSMVSRQERVSAAGGEGDQEEVGRGTQYEEEIPKRGF